MSYLLSVHRCLALFIYLIVGARITAAMSGEALEKTTSHDITISDLNPLKSALRKRLGIATEPTVFIATARVGSSGNIYYCGLTDRGNSSTSALFFGVKINGFIEIKNIDRNKETDGVAKNLCDDYGFYTPNPG